jgi:hypothetical protein
MATMHSQLAVQTLSCSQRNTVCRGNAEQRHSDSGVTWIEILPAPLESLPVQPQAFRGVAQPRGSTPQCCCTLARYMCRSVQAPPKMWPAPLGAAPTLDGSARAADDIWQDWTWPSRC